MKPARPAACAARPGRSSGAWICRGAWCASGADADGGHTHALPWVVEEGYLALRGARCGVVACGRAWALDRRTGAELVTREKDP